MLKNILKNINPFKNENVDNKILFLIKNVLKYFIIFISGLLIAEVIVIGFHYLLGYDPLNGKMMDYDTMLLFKYYGYIISIFTTVLFVKIFDKEKIKVLGFTNKVIDFFKGSLISIVCLFIIIGILLLSKQLNFGGINENVSYKMIILFLGGFIVQGTMEEVLCRGFLFKKLNKKFNVNLSILFSFFVFSFPHFSSLFESSFIIGIIGITNLLLVTYVFSYLMLKYKNIYACSGFHSTWNFILFSIIGLNLSGTTNNYSLLSFNHNNNFLMGETYGIEASIITSVILLSTVIIIKHDVEKKLVK